jgi:uncharacterized membrane protein
MIGRDNEKLVISENRTGEVFLAKNLLTRILLGILIVLGIVIIFLVISNHAQAGDYGVAVQHNTPSNGIANVTPGIDEIYTIDIINTGTLNSGEDLNFTVELDAMSVAAGWTVTPTGTTIIPNLQMGIANKSTEPVTVRAPIDAKFQDTAIVNISVDVIGHKGEVGCQDSLQLRAHVLRVYGVLISPTQSTKTTDPGESVTYNFTIKNEGNAEDTFTLSHSGLELGVWEFSSVTLQPKESKNVNYTVDVDPQHDTTDILITLNASSDGDVTGQTYKTASITIHVNPRYGVKLNAQQNQKDVRGGENVTFSLAITNKGTAVDTYDLDARGLYAFWTSINPSDPTNTTVVVNPGQTVYIDILVSPPEGIAMDLYDIIINVTSQNDGSATGEYTFYANVVASYGFFIWPSSPIIMIEPGGTIHIELWIENEGNADDSYDIIISGLPSGWSYNIGPWPPIPIIKGDSDIIDVWIFTAPGTPVGGYLINITVISINEPTLELTTKLTVNVKQVFGVNISATTTQKSVDVGSYVIYDVEIKNTGNGQDLIELSLNGTYASWALLYYNQTEQGNIIHISPPPGGSLSVKLNVSIPSRIDWENAGSPASFNITIEAKSLFDPNAIPASDTKQFKTTVNSIYEVSLSVTSSSRSGIPGDTVTFSITVYNDGTISDSYNVEIEEFYTYLQNVTIGIWNDENPSPFSPLPPIGPITDGGSQVVTMDITIPSPVDLSEVPPGDYYIVVKVTSQGKPTVWANWTFTVRVKQLYWAWITDSVTSQSVDLGSSVEYLLQVQNKGNDQDTLTIELEDDPNIPGDQSSWGRISSNGQPITSILLNASESKFIILNVSIPDRGSPGYPPIDPTSVVLTVKVSPSNPGAIGAIEDELLVTTNINPIYSFELTSLSPQNRKEADAGDQISFTLQVLNSGTVIDNYRFIALNYDQTIFSISSINNIINLLVNSYGTTNVDISIDPGAQLGTYQIQIIAESENDPSVKQSLNLTVDITGPIYSFELKTTAPLNTKDGKPGESIQFTLEVNNTGTAKDSYEFRITGVDDAIFTVPNPNPISNLAINDIGSTIATVSIIPEMGKALVGSYPIEITATSDGNSGGIRVITLIVNITVSAEVELTPASQQDDGEPEESIDYIIKITNKGNAMDTFDLSLEGTYKDWGEIYDRSGNNIISEVTLKETDSKTGGHFTEIILRVTIPGSGETDAGQIYPITLKAASRNTEGVEDTAQVSTRVEDYIDLILEYSGSGAPRKDFDPNKQSPKFSLRVTNNGNQEEAGMQIRMDDIEDNWSHTPEQLSETLEAGGTLTFSIEFNIPADESEGEYGMQVYIISAVDLSIESNPVLITVNITKPDLSISSSDVAIPDTDYLMGRVGNSVTITATIHNEGHSKAESIQVKLYEGPIVIGTKTISSIDPGSSKDVDFRWTVVAEEVEIKVEITALEEIDDGNNAISPIFLDLRPDLSFTGEQLNFSNTNPSPGDKVTITAFIRNNGGDAEDVAVNFFEGTKIIGTDIIDIDYGEIGEATYEWEVPDKPEESLPIRAEIYLLDAKGNGAQATTSITVSQEEEDGIFGELFSTLSLLALFIGFILGAIIFLILGIAIGSSSRRKKEGRGSEGVAGPGFPALEGIEEEPPQAEVTEEPIMAPPPPTSPEIPKGSMPPSTPPPPPPLDETVDVETSEEEGTERQEGELESDISD